MSPQRTQPKSAGDGDGEGVDDDGGDGDNDDEDIWLNRIIRFNTFVDIFNSTPPSPTWTPTPSPTPPSPTCPTCPPSPPGPKWSSLDGR